MIVLATGDELSQPGLRPRLACAIPDSVSLAVAALVSDWGADIVGMTIVPDRLDVIGEVLVEAIETADIIVIVGGASVGDRDLSRLAARSLGLVQSFAQVAMKPGKPVWHGTASGKHVLGLPGNPTAALTTARLFLAPLICCLTGRGAAAALRWRAATLSVQLAFHFSPFVPSVTKFHGPIVIAIYVFTLVLLSAAGGDIFTVVSGGLSGSSRLARHLWRMCVAMTLATGSALSNGLPRLLPTAYKLPGWTLYLQFVWVVLLLYWLVRIRLRGGSLIRPRRPA